MRTLYLLIVLVGLLLPQVAMAQEDSVVYHIFPGWNLLSIPGISLPPEAFLGFMVDFQAYDPTSRSYHSARGIDADQAKGLWALSDRETTVVLYDVLYYYRDDLVYPNSRGWILAGASGSGSIEEGIGIAGPGEIVPGTIHVWEPGPGAHYQAVAEGERIPVGQGFWMLVDTPPGTLPPDSARMEPCVGPGLLRPERLDSLRITVDHCKVSLDAVFLWNCGTDTTYQAFSISGDTISWHVTPHMPVLFSCVCNFPVHGRTHVARPGEYLVIIYDSGHWVYEERITVTDCP